MIPKKNLHGGWKVYASIISIAMNGMNGYPVRVETDVSPGLPEFSMVGFLSSEVREARERVRTALRNSGFALLPKKITVNLAPADIRKEGTAYDLALAVSLLAANEMIPQERTDGIVFIGELALNGELRPVHGVLPRVCRAKEAGLTTCFLPFENRREGAVVDGIRIIGIKDLREAVHLLACPEEQKPEVCPAREILEQTRTYSVDFSEVCGQYGMKRAAEAAAAGMHNLLLIGSPGSGKSMIARRIPTILPGLTWEECLAVSKVYSVAGLLNDKQPLIVCRPFRAPHHTISTAALIGGGRIPRPGEISLADRGVLFLDELPEFQKNTLEVLRQPMEDRQVMIARTAGSGSFPADTMIVAAMNPCRCGYYPDRSRCQCSISDVRRYLGRISRPLLDRMDLCVEAPPVGYSDFSMPAAAGESSAVIRERVEKARRIQQDRFRGENIFFNAQMQPKHVSIHCRLGAHEERIMKELFETKKLSARAYHRLLKVARTLADLSGEPDIRDIHLIEAAEYRSLEEKYWG